MFVCPECGAAQPMAGACATDGAQLAPVGDDPLLGTAVGVYRIARLLGVGGMGRVYKGVHPQIGSRVAIKVLAREHSERRDLVERFFSEAKAVNLIRHESIVNVLDLATLPDGRPYIVMEFLDGSSLAAIIEAERRRGAHLPLGGVARLVAEVLDALAAAHGKGIIHRDLKPDNIFVTPHGRAKVLDFGIAKLRPELGGPSTQSSSLLGTPHYMSPEQARGRPVDQRADVYAMGVILFECATLRRPFYADSLFELLKLHVEAAPPSPRALRPEIPPDLEQVILAALGKAPEQRFASAQAMSVALQHATSRLPAEAWATVTPADRSASPATWQPTPPASWAASGPPPTGTVTGASGQLAASPPEPKPRRSRKALWLALGAVAVVAGVIITAVAVTSGDEPAKPDEIAHASDPPPPPPPGPKPTPTPVPAPAPDPASETPELPILPGIADMSPEQMDGMIDGMIDGLSPEERKQLLPPEMQAAVKKYGSLSKMPKAEKAKLAGQMVAFMRRMGLGGALTP